MSYQVRNSGPRESTVWNRRSIAAQRFGFPASTLWQQPVLFVVFGVLILLVILGCTVSPTPFVAVALIAALTTAVFAVLYPQVALLLVFTGAGLPTLLIPLPGHPVRPIEAALLLCMLVILFHRPSLRLRLPHLLALLFMAIVIISFIYVPQISTDFYSASKGLYQEILIFVAFFCGSFLARYVKDASSFLVAVLLSNTPLYLIGLAQALHVHVPSMLEYSFAQDPNATTGRLLGPTSGAVIFGSYLINLLAAALACWMLGRRRRDRFIGVIMTVATGLEIIGSGTRGSAIAATIVVIAAFILTRHYKMLFAMLALAGVTAAIFFEKIAPLFTHDPTSANNRFFLSSEAIKLISTHPWIGIGLQQFHYYYAQLIIDHTARLSPHDINVHQQYLQWGMEGGIPWLVVGALLLLSIFFSCWLVYRRTRENAERRSPAQTGTYQILLLAAMLAVLANIIANFFDVPLDQAEGAVFFFLLAGLASSYVDSVRCRKFPQGTPIPMLPKLLPEPCAKVPEIASSGLSGTLPERLTVKEPATSPLIGSGIPSVSITDKAPNAQRTGRTIVMQLLSWGIAIPIIFPVTALLTRYLGPSQYGIYSFTFPFFAIFALLSGTGMDPLIIRRLSRQKQTEWSSILSYAAGTRLISTALSACAAALLAVVLPIAPEQRNLLLIGSISLFFSFSFNGLRMIYSHGFRAEQRAGILFLLETTNRVLTAGLVLLIVLLHLTLLWAYILIVFSDVPFFIVQVVVARRRYGIRLRFSLARVREHLLGSLPLTGYDALALINGQADLILLLVLAGPVSVGIYALATRLTDPLLSVSFAYVNGLYPLLCSKFEEGREQFALVYRQGVRILALGIVPLAIYVSVEAKTIVGILGGQHFAAAATAVQFLIWAVAVAFLHLLAMRSCTAANMERLTPMVTIISASINILLNLLLIPRWQFIGAGAAALSSEIVGLCLYSALLTHRVHLLQTLSVLLRVLLGNLPMLAFLLWQQHMSLLLTAPVALMMSVAGCVATRTLSLEDVFMARRMLFSRRGKESSTDLADWPTVMLPRIQV